MAARGREVNRLYVDTSYDPDADTAHDLGDPVPAEEVLKKALATSGAEQSATQTRDHEAAATSSPGRLEAEGAAIQHHRRDQRYADLLLVAGVPPEHIQAAKTGDRWRPLLDRMRRDEQLGLDLEAGLPAAPQIALSLARFEAGIRAWCDLREGSDGSQSGLGNRPALIPEHGPRPGLDR